VLCTERACPRADATKALDAALRARKPGERFEGLDRGSREFRGRRAIEPSLIYFAWVIAMKQRPPIRGNTSNASPMMQRAVQLHQLGQFDQAERLYKAILATQPADFEALHRRGVLQFQTGRNEEARLSLSAALRVGPAHAAAWSDLGAVQATMGRLEEALTCYDKAIALKPDHATAHSNRGNALVALRRVDEALASFDRALAVKPDLAEALNNRGGLLRDLQRPAEALASLDKALAIKPDYPDALNNRGNALVDLDRAEEALKSYDRALAVNPNSANALNNRGNALIKLGRPKEALANYERALALKPQNPEAWSNRGHALKELKRCDEAIECLNKALSLRPDYAMAFNNLANVFLDLKRPADALATYDRALAFSPDSAIALTNRATALIELKRPTEALESCDKAIARQPGYVDAHNNRGTALSLLGREEEALASYDRAIVLKPDNATAFDNKGVALLQLGRVGEASAIIEAAIELAPGRARSYHHLALSRRFEPGDARLQVMEELALENSSPDASERIYAHFALGKAFADIGDRERSFRHLSDGNALKRQLSPYNEAGALGDLQRTRAAYNSALMGRNRGRGDPSAAPVFVIGMPRSGTTLVEQILASHRDVHGAGEIVDFDLAVAELGGLAGQALRLPEAVSQMSAEQFHRIGASYVRRIEGSAPCASRIINKMTENFRFAGLIALALPNARILHVRRDPIDTCFSCFSTLFVENLPYTYDLAELGRYYRGYEALMNHWREVLPEGMMLEARYEDVVADLDGQGRRIVGHCGLDWDARCLDFHRNKRSVRTASLAQVRRPLYSSSIGRSRAYEAFLGPLQAALGPSIASADRLQTPSGEPLSSTLAA